MKRERVLELVDKWSWWFGVLRDIIRELGEEVKFSDVWSRCVQGRDKETCLGVAMAFAVAVRHENRDGYRVDVFNCLGSCDESDYEVMGELFALYGIDVFPEARRELALTDGYRAMVLDGLVGLAGKVGVDVGRWLDWCVKVFDPVDCVYSAESLLSLKEIKSEIEKYRGGSHG